MPDVATRDKGRRSRHLLVSTIVLALAVLALAGGARAQTELSGIDVSNWQHQIDWLAVAGSGNAFVFAKATEGTTFTDLTFPVNRSGSTVLGMRFGAYHFARPAGSSDAAVVAGAIAQADYFLSVAQPLRGELLPVLDLENTGGLNVARLSLWVQTYLAQIVARTGLKPIVYVSPSFWKSKLGDSPVVAAAGHQLWIAHWTQAALPILPGAAWGGLGWSFWQWSNCRHIPGVSGCVDGDRFNGTSFASVTVPAYPAGPPSRIELPTIVGSPQAGKPLAAVPGTWGGGKPSSFGYQWLRCDATGGACASITGATAESYTPVAADVGHALVARVRAATAAGSASASSLPTLAGGELGDARGHGTEAAHSPGDRRHHAGRPDAVGRRGHLDGGSHLVLVPVAKMCPGRHGLHRDRGRRRHHVHAHTRRSRCRDLARRHRDREGRFRLCHLRADNGRDRGGRPGAHGRHGDRPGRPGRAR